MESAMSEPAHLPAPVDLAPGVPTTTEERTKKVGVGFLVLFGLANFGLYLTVLMPALFSLPYKIGLLAPDGKVAALSFISTIGAIVAIVAGPVAGVLSDRTRNRFGRRRTWFVIGVLILAIGSTFVATAGSVVALAIGWGVVSLGGAATAAAVSPLVAERIPTAQRGTAGAIVGVATQLAGVAGYSLGGALTSSVLLLFLVPVITFAVLGAVFMFLLPEAKVELEPASIRDSFRQMFFDPRKHRDFTILWVGKFLMQTALTFLSTYQLYFLLDRLGFTAETAGSRLAIVGGLGILVTMTFAIGSGIISDRLKRRRIFILMAGVLTLVGMATMAFATGFGLFVAAVLVIVGAAGMFGSVDVALASDLIPEPDRAGKWMTTYNVASGVATAAAPLAGAVLLAIGGAGPNYTALFLAGAGVAVLAGALTMAIRQVR
jgi:MFS family permease